MSGLTFSLLGRLQIEHPRLGVITLANRKAIGLLAYLLIESDRPHSRDMLLGLLWPNLPTAAAQNNLRVTWAYLKKTLAPDDAEPYLISNRLSLGFNLHSEYQLDVARFDNLLALCRTHPHTDQTLCSACAARLTQALELVRGDVLETFSLGDCDAFDEWLRMQREHARIQTAWALEQLATFHERSGQFDEAHQYVRRLLVAEPLRESAYRQFMRVLAGMDRRSAALDVYESCRRVLATELGLTPDVETVALAEQIRARAPLGAPPEHTALPPVLTRFIGRQRECTRLVDLLAQNTVRLVTLAGPGGVGKTRLAIEVAHRLAGVFPHTTCMVELAGIADAHSVEDAVAAALHLPSSGRSSGDAIAAFLHDKTMLLVLDNCEHLRKSCAQLVQRLCREAPGLTVLATSRVPLHLAEEHVVRLEPFATPAAISGERLTVADSLNFDSMQLFAACAAQSRLQFTLNDTNVGAVARICQQLDGMPLAIEIAAAQVRTLPIEAIAERLGQRFTWQHRRAVQTLPRQRTLHTLIDWSYSLLTTPERIALRRFAVFSGGWTLAAAESLGAPEEPCAEILAALVDHSLVVFGADAAGQRYSMHETVRQFALEQLRGSVQEQETFERHARCYAGLVSRASENPEALPFPALLRAVQDDHDNLRQAFRWLLDHDHEQALALVAQLGTALRFWELGGFFQEGRRWLQQALEKTEATISIARGQALLAAAGLSSAIADFAYGLQCAQQAQAMFQQLGDQHGQVDAQLVYCDIARHAGELGDLHRQIMAALDMAEQLSYTAGIAKAQHLLALHSIYTTGDSRTAVRHALASIALWRTLGNPFELATTLNSLGADLLELQEYAASRQAFEECREIYQSFGYRRGVALAMHNLGCIAQHLGDFAQARAELCAALRIRHELGLWRGYAYSFEQLAQLCEREAQFEQAVQLWAAADSLRARIGAPLEYVEQKYQQAALPRLRAQLGELAFELAWARGAHLPAEQAVAMALR